MVPTNLSQTELQNLLGQKPIEQLIYYPYGTKDKKAQSTSLKATAHLLEDLESLIPDKSTLLLDATFEATMNDVLTNQRKVLAIFFGKEEKLDLTYKLLTSNEELKKDVIFAAYFNPPQRLLSSFGLTSENLPRIGGLIPGTMGKESKQYQHPVFLYPSPKPSYPELVEFFKAVVDRAQNKTSAEPVVRRRKGPLTATQLNSTKDFQEYCVDRKTVCFIGLLEANFGPKGEQKLAEQIKVLNTVWEKKENSPMEVMWVNASCHKEILKAFELEEMAVPTVVLYSPKKKMAGNMIGKFDLESVQDYVEGIFIGKTGGIHKMDKAIEITEKDCSQIKVTAGEALSEEERKMLQDIIKEEERKKKELQEKTGYGAGGKKKRPTKKDL